VNGVAWRREWLDDGSVKRLARFQHMMTSQCSLPCICTRVISGITVDSRYTGTRYTGLHTNHSIYRKSQQDWAALYRGNLYGSKDNYTGTLYIPDFFWSRPYKFFGSGITRVYCTPHLLILKNQELFGLHTGIHRLAPTQPIGCRLWLGWVVANIGR
jgi:hypothetical protein